jgi:hypothetical protein
MEIICQLHAPMEFLEHAPPDEAACGRGEKLQHLKEDKHIPFIKPFCINSLQLPELRPTLNS